MIGGTSSSGSSSSTSATIDVGLHRPADVDAVGAGQVGEVRHGVGDGELGDGRESTSPMAPSSSWWVISTTVRRKFGSSSDGDETSSFPASESTAAGSQVPRPCSSALSAAPHALAVRADDVARVGVSRRRGPGRSRARPARGRVALEDVVAGPAVEPVPSGPAEQPVGARPAGDAAVAARRRRAGRFPAPPWISSRPAPRITSFPGPPATRRPVEPASM